MSSTYSEALALAEQGRYADAEAVLREGLRANPVDRRASAALARLQLLQGRATPAPDSVEAAVALAQTLASMQGAVALQGADEGPRLQAAVELIQAALPNLPDAAKPAAARILWRTGYYADARALGGVAELGREVALHGAPELLLHQLARIETDADRLEVVRQHQLWGERIERSADAPAPRPPRDPPRGKIRLGFLSSDLRHHVVAFFAQPLFEFLDPRFEIYCYSSFRGAPDLAQQWITGRSTAYRILPVDDQEAAEVVAADDLDLLIEMGGTTSLSRPGVLARKPARLQASWLGYPQSLGLAAIDFIVVDPYLAPPRRELLLETPLKMPACWICMAPAAFQPVPALDPVPPVERTGQVTFGTANDPYKFNPRLLRTWARIVAATPGSRFMFLRPEAGARSFRENMARHFAQEGVGVERLDFRPVRGGIRPIYREMDIALDTFPLTGGTTTCEALWMGVPTVTLVGEAMFERLGWSILNNAGLADLAATTVEDYVRIAVDLAASPARLSELRQGMRSRLGLMPLGQPRPFAQAFYDLMAATIVDRTEGQAS
jgi:predicted O-linked N-acetylglucosamine transferase (SPINDLY family)